MTVYARSSASVDLPIGGVWAVEVHVTDADGDDVAGATVVVTVTLPAGGTATPTVTELSCGRYRAEYVVATAGRYIARAVTTTYGTADFTAWVTATVAGTAMPNLAAAKVYLKIDEDDTSQDVDIADALAAEAAAQRAVCRVPAAYPDDLRQALLRRVARNLALRGLPIMVLRGDAESGSTIPPGRDSEVRRFEGPYRKLRTG